MADTIKILVVDDTIVYRKILSLIIAELDDVDLIGTSPNGKIALTKINLSKPDLVLLDISMPVMDGIETLTHIKKDYPEIDVIMVSGTDAGNANLTMKALNLGALDFVPKPVGGTTEESVKALKTALTPLMSLVRTRKYSRNLRGILRDKKPAEKAAPEPVTPALIKEPPAQVLIKPQRIPFTGRVDVVALGVSTGGPNALEKVIPLIKDSFRVPILAVQHMPPAFTASLANRLDKSSEISVVEGKDGEHIENGRMYIAPGGYHMVVRRGLRNHNTIGVTQSPPVNSCRPSVDVLFRSIAMVYGGNILTLILTGMGNDGAAGVSAIRRKGGYSIVQDEETCVVWGMPQAVVAANEADEILPLEQIAVKLMKIVG